MSSFGAELLMSVFFHHPHLENSVRFQFCYLKKDVNGAGKAPGKEQLNRSRGRQGCQVRNRQEEYGPPVWRDKG